MIIGAEQAGRLAGLMRTDIVNKKFWDVFCGIEESNAVVWILLCHWFVQ